MKHDFILPTETETLALGAKLAAACSESCIIFLNGELGAGKTTLVRGFLQGLGYKDHIKSPTYTLVEPYEIGHKIIFHFDLYRIKDPNELENIGIRDYFTHPAIILIEWPERGEKQLPIPDLTCTIETFQAGRRLQVVAMNECGSRVLQQLTKPIKSHGKQNPNLD